ncbi:MAG: 4-alpha-glucanotransferase [Prevotella sp.]|nr:4-alpha-glucanotransferase [Prevotella sp.]
MKLKFNIQYNTEWGQAMHLLVKYKTSDGRSHEQDLMMQTQDGGLWWLDVVLMESRQRRIIQLEYVYQVENTEGQVLRREWNQVKRLYATDNTKTFCFSDLWRDVPLNYHLYTYINKRYAKGIETLALPLFRKTVVFRVSAPQLAEGESLALVGNHPAIGSWNPTRYLPLQHIGEFDWMLSVNVDGMLMPLEYKYVIIDDNTRQLKTWEEGDNRTTGQIAIADGEVHVLYGDSLRVKETTWKAAGVVVPLFSLRSERSCGVGDFTDLKMLADWASLVGMKVIQLLPVNDTTSTHTWNDSHPYNIISAFALHPHYIDLDQLPLSDKEFMRKYAKQRRELNALHDSDYLAVDRVKWAYLRKSFEESGKELMESKPFKSFFAENEDWLPDYAEFCVKRDCSDADEEQRGQIVNLHYFVQYHLHSQFLDAANYARSKGVSLKGDLPIGVCRDSVETWKHPDFFNLDMQTGTPPDAYHPNGQNWGFPTYRWNIQSKSDDQMTLNKYFRRRFQWMEQYFDAFRIDHVVGYFRLWEIPKNAVYATMGHFHPALPMSREEIEQMGLTFHQELYTRPFINDRILDRIFGIHAQFVRDNFLVRKQYGLYGLKSDYDTQQKVRAHFEGHRDENSLWIREGLYRIISNVLFIEDARQPGMFHPRFGIDKEPVYDILGKEEKEAFMRIYNSYFYERHNGFWAWHALRLLADILQDTRMLVCAEDLGMLPASVSHVLDTLRILTLEIQSMPKDSGVEFTHLEANPYRSVATISTHDMPSMRLWWEENAGRAQRYFTTMLQREGRAPQNLSAQMAEEIVARHLYCPSMLCLLSIQDWLAMDSNLRTKNVREERINEPYDCYNQWKYRMNVTIEQLMEARQYNQKLQTMITRSKRIR